MSEQNVSYEKFKCDRCGVTAERHQAVNTAHWGKMWAVRQGGSQVIAAAAKPVDLCGSCAASLSKWFTEAEKC